MTGDDTSPTWGDRWLAEMGRRGPAYAERLSKGPYYVSRGAVRSLQVTPGELHATVQHGRQRAQSLLVTAPPFAEDEWERLVRTLAGELRFSARLLDGDLPVEVQDALAEHDVSLLPPHERVAEQCICTGEGAPCIHLAAVHHAFARRLDDDPFLLLTLRGRDRDTLLAAVRAHRSGTDLRTAQRSPDAAPVEELDPAAAFSARGDLDAIGIHPHQVEDPAWLFDHLGEPPGVEDTEPLHELVGAAADTAWRLAAGEGASVADDELLLGELRSQRMATADTLAEALGWDVEVTRDALDRLFEAGDVLKAGDRYRAGMG